MARVVLGVTGSVAAIRTGEVVAALVGAGHEVRVVLTEAARYFATPEGLRAAFPAVAAHVDADEWPPPRYERGDPVLHIELRKWAEALVVAPLDAHTLAKLALGLSDNLLSCLLRAWDFARPVVLAPAMNTLMWDSPVTRRHLAQVLADRGDGPVPARWLLDDAPALFARLAPGIALVPPQEKRLACGDVGPGAMAEPGAIAAALGAALDAAAPATAAGRRSPT